MEQPAEFRGQVWGAVWSRRLFGQFNGKAGSQEEWLIPFSYTYTGTDPGPAQVYKDTPMQVCVRGTDKDRVVEALRERVAQIREGERCTEIEIVPNGQRRHFQILGPTGELLQVHSAGPQATALFVGKECTAYEVVD